MKRRAFFFDRDGVVNRDPHPDPYVLTWDQWVWSDGLREALEAVRRRGFLAILVTSQRGVEKGLMSKEDLDSIHRRMQESLGELAFDAIYAYTGGPGEHNEPKPSPQMIWRAMTEWAIDLSSSWLIGDADRDLLMGQRAGVGRLVRMRGLKPVSEPADHEVADLREFVHLLDRELPDEFHVEPQAGG